MKSNEKIATEIDQMFFSKNQETNEINWSSWD